MRVLVETGSRLHLGFIDPAGRLGRRWGSVGLYIEEPRLVLEAWKASRVEVDGPIWLWELAERVVEVLGIEGLGLRTRSQISMHVGLGSGTQSALAVASAASKLYGLSFNPVELALALGRCQRSGVGLWLFLGGGLAVDGGLGAEGVPPLLARLRFPESWGIILLVPDSEGGGLHGAAEEEALKSVEGGEPERAAATVLLRLLPSILEMDFEGFCSAVEELDRLTGSVFSRIQGGTYSETTSMAVKALRDLGARGVGQSSWGPTVYGFAESHEEARRIAERLKVEDFRAILTRARNKGAEIRSERE